MVTLAMSAWREHCSPASDESRPPDDTAFPGGAGGRPGEGEAMGRTSGDSSCWFLTSVLPYRCPCSALAISWHRTEVSRPLAHSVPLPQGKQQMFPFPHGAFCRCSHLVATALPGGQAVLDGAAS